MNGYHLTRRNQKNDLFDMFDDFFKPMFYDEMHDMRTDIKETETEYELEIEMPGFTKEQIAVSLEDGYLTVSGAKNENKKDAKYIHKEIKESFSRSYYVGSEISEESVKAKYENGILTLVVPKAAPKQISSRSIPIE